MTRPFALLLLALIVPTEGRVTFPSAEVLDSVDLKNKVTAPFKCSGGCRVFSPTRNSNIVIVDAAGKEVKSLLDLSNLLTTTVYELPAGNGYTLKNKVAGNPNFVFYVVEKGAPNYNAKVAYVNAGSPTTRVTVTTDSLLTVLSDSGVVRVTNFAGDYSKDLPLVYATGFDSIGCRPVYTASSFPTVANTFVTVYGPIATVNMKSTNGAKSFMISGSQLGSDTPSSKDSSAVFVSPGYVGCSTTGDSLYSLTYFTGLNSFYSRTDSNGLVAVVAGDYSIANQADALELTINDNVKKLYGKQTDRKSYESTSFKIKVGWTAKEGSTDRFALQIDLTAKGGNAGLPSTTQMGSSLSFLSSVFAVFLFLFR